MTMELREHEEYEPTPLKLEVVIVVSLLVGWFIGAAASSVILGLLGLVLPCNSWTL